jgi:hypothetical protein
MELEMEKNQDLQAACTFALLTVEVYSSPLQLLPLLSKASGGQRFS